MVTSEERKFGWWDMFVAPDDDPRSDGGFKNTERDVLLSFLSDQRLTFQLKCADLDAEQMARRSVEPSNLSLLGLLRHLAGVERIWFRRRMAGQDVPRANRRASRSVVRAWRSPQRPPARARVGGSLTYRAV